MSTTGSNAGSLEAAAFTSKSRFDSDVGKSSVSEENDQESNDY